jgi:uncharacterized protein (TIGR03083 family)
MSIITPDSIGEETATHYTTAHGRIVALVDDLTDEQLATPVPATPGWTVHDVLAHLVAVPTDGMAGRITGIPTEEFTAGQIAERRDRTAAQLLEEWQPNVEPMCEGARVDLVPPHLAVDALTHEQDIRGAIGLPAVLSPEELRFCTTLYASGCGFALMSAGLPALAIESTDTGLATLAGEGEQAAAVRAAEFELFRALSGRRSREQVAAFDWTGGAALYLDAFCLFGPLREQNLYDA